MGHDYQYLRHTPNLGSCGYDLRLPILQILSRRSWDVQGC